MNHERACIWDHEAGAWALLDEAYIAKRWLQYAEVNRREREDLWR